jgi:endonuclease/exonuclease/phosphatase (EEP) superfamily protein YafD
MGDMNDFNRSAPLDTLTGGGLKDSWLEGGFGYGATFHKGWMRLRIDHILHSKELNLESIEVIETKLSDHNPVVAGFSLKN